MTKLTVARALTARVASRAIRLATIMSLAVFAIIFVVSAALVYVFSPWWWLLLLPFIVLLGVFLILRLIATALLRRMYGRTMTMIQRQSLDQFVDKIQQLLEARATPLPLFVAITIKDLVLHRDITTIKKLIADTASLRRDYEALEPLF